MLAFVERYRQCMRRFSEMTVLDLARYQIFRVAGPVKSVLRKAERATPAHNLQKLTVFANGKHRFREERPTQFHIPPAVATAVIDSLRSYARTLSAGPRFFLLPVRSGRRRLSCCWYGQRRHARLRAAHVRRRHRRPALPSGQGGATVVLRCLTCRRATIPYITASALPKASAPCRCSRTSSWDGPRIDGRDYMVRQLRDHKACIEADVPPG